MKIRYFVLLIFFSSFLFSSIIQEKEPNNTFYTANLITVNDRGDGALDYYRDSVDVWKIIPNEDGEVVLETNGSIINMDVQVYNQNGYLIAYDTSSNNNVKTSFFVKKGEIYYIALYLSQRGNTTYSLNFSFTPFMSKNVSEFKPIFNKNLNGALLVIGNHNVCFTNGGIVCLNPGGVDNNNIYQNYVNVDQEAVSNNFINSSESDLNLNNEDKVIKAYLFWMGRIFTNDPLKSEMVSNANKVKFKTPTTNGYIDIEANESSFNWYYGSDGVFDYGAYADVTPYVTKSGKYYVANLQVSEGKNTGGGWSLVIVTQNPKDKFKKIVVYQGFQAIYNYLDYPHSITQTLSGFYTPISGTVDANFILFANETDIALGDSITLTDKNGNPHYLFNNLNPSNNVLNCTISKDGKNVITRDPNYLNTLGTDIDEFDISNILDNEQTQTDITIRSNGDRIFLSMFGISIQLYTPKICYYDLNLYRDDQLVTPATKLYVGDKIKVSLKIKNDDNEIAKYVHFIYPIDENITEYENNTTKVKNVLSNDYVLIEDNTTKNGISVIFDKNTLEVGVLGDSNKEFLPYALNRNYVAGIEFNETIKNEGNLSFTFYTDYNFTIGNETYNYHGILESCDNENNNYNAYVPEIGSFNVVHYQPNITIDPEDVNDPINALYTQIVNKDGNFTLVHLGDDNKTLTSYTGVVRVDLIKNPSDENECKINPPLESIFVIMLNTDKVHFKLAYNKALKDARFRISYLKFKNSGCMNALLHRVRNEYMQRNFDNAVQGNFEAFANYNWGDEIDFYASCSLNCAVQCAIGVKNCLRCVFGDVDKESFCSRDHFAIRPYKYKITPISSSLKAGDEFNLIIKAVDYNGLPVVDYNESINITTKTSAYLDYNDTNASKGCNRGNLDFALGSNTQFVNGYANVRLKYSEVGDLNITIKEINSTEFAKVDINDTSNRFIKPDSILLKFIPYDFIITSSFDNFNNGNFTYLSNNLLDNNMSATLGITLKAVNKDSVVLQNYNKNCYAKDIAFSALYNYNATDINNPKYLLVNDDKNLTTTKTLAKTKVFSRVLSKNYFETNGLANINIHINFSKDYKNPINPFDMNITQMSFNDGDINKNLTLLTSNVIFYYGRIFAPNISGYPKTVGSNYQLSSNFVYQYWVDEWKTNKDHNSSYGVVKDYYPKNIVTLNLNTINNGDQNISVSTNKIPISEKLHLSIPSYLWYHPLAKDYKDPSATNLDCLTHPCFKVDFLKQSSGWGGIGVDSNTTKYNEENRTVKTKSNIKTDKNSFKKINW